MELQSSFERLHLDMREQARTSRTTQREPILAASSGSYGLRSQADALESVVAWSPACLALSLSLGLGLGAEPYSVRACLCGMRREVLLRSSSRARRAAQAGKRCNKNVITGCVGVVWLLKKSIVAYVGYVGYKTCINICYEPAYISDHYQTRASYPATTIRASQLTRNRLVITLRGSSSLRA